MKNYLSKFLDDPSGLDALSKKGSYFYLTLSIVLIFLTPILLYVELVSPVLYNKYLNIFLNLDLFIITFF